ncbi:MAG: helix-turn-helix domain-containing protein [Ruminococcus sp.]|nr:helix-turn-helix domain-containing protein [Ruminococcus sp.]MCM1478144.1 helix-turn-helix domain-containing protein [Muribaculaceae bacterium]
MTTQIRENEVLAKISKALAEISTVLAEFSADVAKISDDEKIEPTTTKLSSKPTMLTIKECAELTNISAYSIRKFAQQKKIVSTRTGEGKNGKILVNFDSLIDYLNS